MMATDQSHVKMLGKMPQLRHVTLCQYSVWQRITEEAAENVVAFTTLCKGLVGKR